MCACVRVRLCVHLVAVVASVGAMPRHRHTSPHNLAQRRLSIQKFTYAMIYTEIEFTSKPYLEDGHVKLTCTAQVRVSLISMKLVAAM